jgi:hypothetical protein
VDESHTNTPFTRACIIPSTDHSIYFETIYSDVFFVNDLSRFNHSYINLS